MQSRRTFRASSSSVAQRGSVSQAPAVPTSRAREPRYSAPTVSGATRGRRSQSSALFVPTSDVQRVQGMNRQLERINSRIEQKLQLYRQEAESSQFLLTRARRLTERLDILKHKLRLCFDMCGTEHPPNLQLVLQQMEANNAQEPDDAPAEFTCPITQSLMIDPVRTSDGHCYDRAAIFEWFVGFEAKGQCPTSPLTNLILVDTTLTADSELRQQIQAFLAAHREATGRSDGEEPSTRLLPPSAIVPPHLPPPAAPVASRSTRPSGAPIWSSSVVPPNEANSRELNQLRMSDVDVPPPPALVGLRIVPSLSPSMRGRDAASAPRHFQAQLHPPHQQPPPPPREDAVTSNISPVGSFRDQQRRLQEGLVARGLLPISSNATNSLTDATPVGAASPALHTGGEGSVVPSRTTSGAAVGASTNLHNTPRVISNHQSPPINLNQRHQRR
jgi:hypothetical protein